MTKGFWSTWLPLVGAIIVGVAATACESPAGAAKEQAGLRPGAPNFAVSEAMNGRVTMRISADSAPDRKYYVGIATSPGGLADLATKLTGARAGRASEPTLYMYTYPGTRGFDVIMALKAARAAGFRSVEGYADFTDDASDPARANWKHWTKVIDSLPASDGPQPKDIPLATRR